MPVTPLTRTPPGPAPEAGEMHLGAWLAELWEGRWLTLAGALLFLGAGSFLQWRAAPVFQAEGLLQLPEQRPASDPGLGKAGIRLPESGDAQAEVEILKSSLILGRAVQVLGLDVAAYPELPPVIGAALVRGRADEPRLVVRAFQIPAPLEGKRFRVTALGGDECQWRAPDGALLGTGRCGEPLLATLDGAPARLVVDAITARPGQAFVLFRKPLVAAIGDLRRAFDASEKGKLTNVIGLTCRGPSPARCEAALNAIMDQYLAYKRETRAAAADEARAQIEARLGPIKAALDASEARLSAFRSRFGSVDLSKEAESLLQQSTSLAAQVSSLELKKQEALRTYRDNADVVATLDRQVATLQEEAATVAQRMRALPGTQQEVLRLSRDVQSGTELFTSLQAEAQQLKLAGVGEGGGIVLVDPARAEPEPLGPNPRMMAAFFLVLGACAGAAVGLLRQLLPRGVKDPRVVSAELGLPVLVTVPHSREQVGHARAVSRGQAGNHLLALRNSGDPAVESLRSLRTVLYFSLRNAPRRVLAVTGPAPSVGKSFLCCNLAIIFAQAGGRVLLVDGDLRRGTLYRCFGLKSRSGGLSDVLEGRSLWRNWVHHSAAPGLDVLCAGAVPPDPSELLMSPRFHRFVQEVAAEYDYVLFDAPPLLPVTDAMLIAACADCVLMVAKYGQHPPEELRACQERLESQGVAVAGCVFNDILPTSFGYDYAGYSCKYQYR